MSNVVHLTIRDCQHCPCAVTKPSKEGAMYCQTNRSLIMLRKEWGPRDVPDWCPILARGTKKW